MFRKLKKGTVEYSENAAVVLGKGLSLIRCEIYPKSSMASLEHLLNALRIEYQNKSGAVYFRKRLPSCVLFKSYFEDFKGVARVYVVLSKGSGEGAALRFGLHYCNLICEMYFSQCRSLALKLPYRSVRL